MGPESLDFTNTDFIPELTVIELSMELHEEVLLSMASDHNLHRVGLELYADFAGIIFGPGATYKHMPMDLKTCSRGSPVWIKIQEKLDRTQLGLLFPVILRITSTGGPGAISLDTLFLCGRAGPGVSSIIDDTISDHNRACSNVCANRSYTLDHFDLISDFSMAVMNQVIPPISNPVSFMEMVSDTMYMLSSRHGQSHGQILGWLLDPETFLGKMSRSHNRICSNCGGAPLGDQKKLTKCAGCLLAYYCSKPCQAQDWKHKGHRDECPELRRIPIEMVRLP